MQQNLFREGTCPWCLLVLAAAFVKHGVVASMDCSSRVLKHNTISSFDSKLTSACLKSSNFCLVGLLNNI